VKQSKITTAVIPVAGFGSRMLPLTKAIEKCMIPIGSRPVVEYIVERCVQAGITNIIFVVSPDSMQLRTYFGHNLLFEKYLKDHNKEALLSVLNAPGKGINISYVTQDLSRYGTAVPVFDALGLVPDHEQFLVVMGDDFLYRTDGGNDLSDLINAVQIGGYKHGTLGTIVPEKDVSKYGILELNSDGTLKNILEKPQLHEVTSHLANLSKLVYDKDSLKPVITKYMNSPLRSPEYYLTDVSSDLAQEMPFLVVESKGRQMDTGSPEGLAECWRILVK
jgi:UTP--glucose-1-phosphate uridylyltransferase